MRETIFADVMFPVRTLALDKKAVPETLREEVFAVAMFPVEIFAVKILDWTRLEPVETVSHVTFAPVETFRDETFAVVTLRKA